MAEINFIRPQEVRESSSSHVVRYFGYDGMRYIPTYGSASDAPLMPADIADNLTTNSATKVLSAKQGKVLKDEVDTKITASALAGFCKVVDVTHAELAAAKTAGTLVAGYVYRITDYPLGESDPQGDVLVLATGASTLNTNVWVLPTVAYADPRAES